MVQVLREVTHTKSRRPDFLRVNNERRSQAITPVHPRRVSCSCIRRPGLPRVKDDPASRIIAATSSARRNRRTYLDSSAVHAGLCARRLGGALAWRLVRPRRGGRPAEHHVVRVAIAQREQPRAGPQLQHVSRTVPRVPKPSACCATTSATPRRRYRPECAPAFGTGRSASSVHRSRFHRARLAGNANANTI